ncbi:hypothetical protein DFH09DRAFT_1165299 [Mycena vulgaris]|nr:hypothetical protein DFH09DRAFT_1165299 [Mycena vulgaris]
MPIFNSCNGVQIEGGTFYEVSGDVTLHTHQQLMIGDQTATAFQMVPSLSSASAVELENGGAEASRRESGVVRNHRRIVAPVPYDASSRPRPSPRGSSDLQGHFVPSASTSNALIPSSELSRLDPFDPWPNPRYPIHSQYSNFSVEPRQDAPVSFSPDDYSLSNIEPSPPTSDYGVNPFVNRPYSFNYQQLRNISREHDHQNFPLTPAIQYSLPDAQPSPNNLPAYGGNPMTAYSNHVEAEPAPAIHSGTFINAQNVHNNYRQGETGINILHRAVALEALHDSGDSFPQPKCHPETRKKMLDDLWEYATNPQPPDQILWLYGPAGAGKSAIMWSLCERLQAAGRLGGTFFFKRGHPTRGNAKALFSTIAYRLALRIPSLKGPISQAVEDDPSLVAGTPEVQFKQLILGPSQSLTNHQPVIIIIDGLDECDGHHMQQEMLRILYDCFPQHQNFLRIIIASRPEAHITEMTSGAYQAVNVEQSFDDVQKYLMDEFARIHRDHPRTMAKIPSPWPSEEEVATLVSRSSGHFIYASTIIKFIDDPNFRPTQRLSIALGNSAEINSDSPFSALDQLYTQILNSATNNSQLLNILRVIAYLPRFAAYQIDQLLDLEPGDTALVLRGLHSLIHLDTPFQNSFNHDHEDWGNITWHHASFDDFLHARTRSGKFYVGGLTPLMGLAQCILKALAYKNDDNCVWWHKPRPHVAWDISWEGIRYLVSSVPPSAELLPLIRLINPIFLFDESDPIEEAKLISWFKQIHPVPTDLIRLWEDYIFMANFALFGSESDESDLDPALDLATSEECQRTLTESPGLLQIFHASDLLSRGTTNNISLSLVQIFLDMPWGEIRSMISPLRDIIGDSLEKLEALGRFMLNATQNYQWANINKKLAHRCLRILKDSRELHVQLWAWNLPRWGFLIRLSPPCVELLQEICEFIPPFWMCAEEMFRPIDIHNIVQWLKSQKFHRRKYIVGKVISLSSIIISTPPSLAGTRVDHIISS